jgi:hypothetical protein
VQPLHEIEELLIHLKVVDESYIVKMHMQNLWKQGLAWKFHNCNFLTWTLFNVNNNQTIDHFQNQTMCCIVYHD